MMAVKGKKEELQELPRPCNKDKVRETKDDSQRHMSYVRRTCVETQTTNKSGDGSSIRNITNRVDE